MALSQPAASIGLAIGLTAVAGVLAWRQRHERRHREPGLSEADARHFARQDFRRAIAGAVMVLLAPGIVVGARIEPKLAGRPNLWFLAVWLAIFALILALLGLALLDWIATWRYARRHHRALARERLQFLRDEQRRNAYRGNGRGAPEAPQDGAPAP